MDMLIFKNIFCMKKKGEGAWVCGIQFLMLLKTFLYNYVASLCILQLFLNIHEVKRFVYISTCRIHRFLSQIYWKGEKGINH